MDGGELVLEALGALHSIVLRLLECQEHGVLLDGLLVHEDRD